MDMKLFFKTLYIILTPSHPFQVTLYESVSGPNQRNVAAYK